MTMPAAERVPINATTDIGAFRFDGGRIVVWPWPNDAPGGAPGMVYLEVLDITTGREIGVHFPAELVNPLIEALRHASTQSAVTS